MNWSCVFYVKSRLIRILIDFYLLEGDLWFMGGNKTEKEVIDCILENKENFYRVAYSYVKNSEDALDIVQESIQKALVSVSTLQKQTAIKSWLYRIVVNTSLDFLRKHKRVIVVDEQKIDSFHTGLDDHYENIDLKKALEELPAHYREVIILRYYEDLKLEEVAEIMQENINTIKTRIQRALKMLRLKMDEPFEEVK